MNHVGVLQEKSYFATQLTFSWVATHIFIPTTAILQLQYLILLQNIVQYDNEMV